MIYTSYLPPISLLPYIDRYWRCSSESETDIDMFPLFAGTGLDLIIHFSSPFNTDGSKLDTSHTTCPRQAIQISSEKQLDFLAVRFCCGSFRHFCSVNFKELNNAFLSVLDIWGESGAELLNKLNEEQLSADRIEILNKFFLKQLAIHNKTIPILDNTISYIYNNYDGLSICSLTADMKISLRHFERMFKEEFGISPKKFQTISRFQTTIRELVLSSNKDYLPVALNNGYYDQSHFIRECKLLSSMSPLEILNQKDKSIHFYFKKYN